VIGAASSHTLPHRSPHGVFRRGAFVFRGPWTRVRGAGVEAYRGGRSAACGGVPGIP
jgi:hypothetical protein